MSRRGNGQLGANTAIQRIQYRAQNAVSVDFDENKNAPGPQSAYLQRNGAIELQGTETIRLNEGGSASGEGEHKTQKQAA